jgi:hypothetical protein
VFVGEAFEVDPTMRQVKSLMLDYFRGRQVRAVAGWLGDCCPCMFVVGGVARQLGAVRLWAAHPGLDPAAGMASQRGAAE